MRWGWSRTSRDRVSRNVGVHFFRRHGFARSRDGWRGVVSDEGLDLVGGHCGRERRGEVLIGLTLVVRETNVSVVGRLTAVAHLWEGRAIGQRTLSTEG